MLKFKDLSASATAKFIDQLNRITRLTTNKMLLHLNILIQYLFIFSSYLKYDLFIYVHVLVCMCFNEPGGLDHYSNEKFFTGKRCSGSQTFHVTYY